MTAAENLSLLSRFRLDMKRVLSAQTPENSPLPASKQEIRDAGWAQADIILVTGDAYIDHPSFGAPLLGRLLQWLGYRVAIIAQPDVSDPGCMKELGPPRLFWGITAGNVDSQLSHLTVMRKRRRDDPYSPEGRAGRRPPNATISYTALARHAAPDKPVVIGGIEASLRTFAYYDYWSDKVRRSILADSKADILVYGMAEAALAEIAWCIEHGLETGGIRGTAVLKAGEVTSGKTILLPSYEEVASPSHEGKALFSRMTASIHKDRLRSPDLPMVQKHGHRYLCVNPAQPPLQTADMDLVYSLPYTRLPHPSYRGSDIPAYDMICNSVTTHRGCCANCSFCAITVHQGQAVSSRSRAGILEEIGRLARQGSFKGTITDLGGPTANMYGFYCRLGRSGCPEKNCIYPEICRNLHTDHNGIIEILRAARRSPGVKHAFVSSGIRFDLALSCGGKKYIDEIAAHHTGGLLKIAPEHISDSVLRHMRKPSVKSYRAFVRNYLEASRVAGKKQTVVEYFVSGHPGCTLEDMVDLALYLRKQRIKPEQVQDFYPAPMTIAASMYYTGEDPLTGEKVYSAKTDAEKALQRAILLSHDPAFMKKAEAGLLKAGRSDLLRRLKASGSRPDY